MRCSLLLLSYRNPPILIPKGHYFITIASFRNGDWFVRGYSEANNQGSLTPLDFDSGIITNLACRSLSNQDTSVQERISISGLDKNNSIKVTRLDTNKSTTIPKHANTSVWVKNGVNDPIFKKKIKINKLK